MTDLSLTIAPKSDQINADDLIAGPLTITVTKVSANPSSAEQPISINFEGDNGKPYRPCKIMRRVMVQVWGKDGAAYTGRSMTIYRDPKVQFGGLEVGGIRISHMSHIDKDVTMALTMTRANRRPFTVRPLVVEPPKAARSWADIVGAIAAKANAVVAVDQIDAFDLDSDVLAIHESGGPKVKERLASIRAAMVERVSAPEQPEVEAA